MLENSEDNRWSDTQLREYVRRAHSFVSWIGATDDEREAANEHLHVPFGRWPAASGRTSRADVSLAPSSKAERSMATVAARSQAPSLAGARNHALHELQAAIATSTRLP